MIDQGASGFLSLAFCNIASSSAEKGMPLTPKQRFSESTSSESKQRFSESTFSESKQQFSFAKREGGFCGSVMSSGWQWIRHVQNCLEAAAVWDAKFLVEDQSLKPGLQVQA
jgi:hypothetical protein